MAPFFHFHAQATIAATPPGVAANIMAQATRSWKQHIDDRS
jgi:hypothetical protein